MEMAFLPPAQIVQENKTVRLTNNGPLEESTSSGPDACKVKVFRQNGNTYELLVESRPCACSHMPDTEACQLQQSSFSRSYFVFCVGLFPSHAACPPSRVISAPRHASLSYAILREILYTRTTHVKMRVHRPTYIALSRRKFRHIDTPKVRPRGQGTISEHAHQQDTAHGTQTSNIPKSHFHVPELCETPR